MILTIYDIKNNDDLYTYDITILYQNNKLHVIKSNLFKYNLTLYK